MTFTVRHLSVKDASDDLAKAAVEKLVRQVLRYAPANLSAKRRLVLFEWDAVYFSVTVTFTTPGRKHQASDVFKVFFQAWDERAQELSTRRALSFADDRANFVFCLVEEQLEARDSKRTEVKEQFKARFAWAWEPGSRLLDTI